MLATPSPFSNWRAVPSPTSRRASKLAHKNTHHPVLIIYIGYLRFARGCLAALLAGSDTQVAANRLGVAREGWGCHPGLVRISQQSRTGLLRARPFAFGRALLALRKRAR